MFWEARTAEMGTAGPDPSGLLQSQSLGCIFRRHLAKLGLLHPGGTGPNSG